MSCRKFLVSAGMIALVLGLITLSSGWASEPPPEGGQIVGPEFWGTLVINESPANAAVRVKWIKDCVVSTEAEWVTTNVNFPEIPTDPLNYTWDGGTFFSGDPDIPPTGVPIITKVKNFKIEGTAPNRVCSFDAQVKFHVP